MRTSDSFGKMREGETPWYWEDRGRWYASFGTGSGQYPSGTSHITLYQK